MVNYRLWQKPKRVLGTSIEEKGMAGVIEEVGPEEMCEMTQDTALTECVLVFVHMHGQAECGGLRASVCLRSVLPHCAYTVQSFFG